MHLRCREASADLRAQQFAELRERLDAWLERDPHASAWRYVGRLMLCISASHRLKVSRSEVEIRLADGFTDEIVDRLVAEEAVLVRERGALAAP